MSSITLLPPTGIPEVNLWIAKLNQQLEDLAITSKKPEKIRAKEQAERLFFRDYDQLEMVCDAAGFPVEYVLKAAHRVRREGIFWRAAAGAGKNYQRGKKYRTLHRIPKVNIIQEQTEGEFA